MKKQSQVRMGTEEDLIRDFGPGGLLIGSPVRPTPSTCATSSAAEPLAKAQLNEDVTSEPVSSPESSQ